MPLRDAGSKMSGIKFRNSNSLTKFNFNKSNNNNEKQKPLPFLNGKESTFYNKRVLFFMTLLLPQKST